MIIRLLMQSILNNSQFDKNKKLKRGKGNDKNKTPRYRGNDKSETRHDCCSTDRSQDSVRGVENHRYTAETLDTSEDDHSTSPLSIASGVSLLDEIIRARKEEGLLTSNVVHIEVPGGMQIEEVYNGVHSGPVLGSGVSGIVRLVTHSRTGIKYAVKCLELDLIGTEEGVEQLKQEIQIMSELDHPFINRIVEVYETFDEIYLVEDLCTGGELLDRLEEQPNYHYTEKQCARLVKQMLSAVRYIHSKGIIHRDLKLENFLFTTDKDDSELKLIDFGLSKHFRSGELLHDRVGTPYTVAPEVIKGDYDERCDLWGIGVLTYILLSGEAPFGGCGGTEPLAEIRENILRGEFKFEPKEVWCNVSEDAKDFIQSLLVTNPLLRSTAAEAQMHPWLEKWTAKKTNRGKRNVLNPHVVNALTRVKKQSTLRRIMREVISFSLVPEQVQDLYEDFEKMDLHGSGEISLRDFQKTLLESVEPGTGNRLNEKDVVDIFNAMHIQKSEKCIQWHEFIAAVLDEDLIDERILCLAFDRLDNGHKGYITFEDIVELMGSDGLRKTQYYKKMFMEGIFGLNCHGGRIYYEDFLCLMKRNGM